MGEKMNDINLSISYSVRLILVYFIYILVFKSGLFIWDIEKCKVGLLIWDQGSS